MKEKLVRTESNMTKPTGKVGAKHFSSAAEYSARGIRAAWKNEFAFRTELRLLLLFVPGAFLLGQSAVEISILLLPLFVVLIAELCNTAIETLCDKVSSEYDPLVGQAKDIGSAVVLTSLLATCTIWLLFVFERLNISQLWG